MIMQSAQIVIPVTSEDASDGVVLLDDVKLDGISMPKHGLTGLFGYRYLDTVLSRIKKANPEKTHGGIKLWVNINNKISSRSSLENIGQLEILRLNNSKVELVNYISKISLDLYKEQTGKKVSGYFDPTKHLDVMIDAIKKDPKLSSIKMVSYTVETKQFGDVDIATVIDRSAICRVFAPEEFNITKITVKQF